MHVLSIVVEIGAVYVALLFAPLLFALSHSTTMSKQSHKNTANESSIESSNIMQLTQLTQLVRACPVPLIDCQNSIGVCLKVEKLTGNMIHSMLALVYKSFLINLDYIPAGAFWNLFTWTIILARKLSPQRCDIVSRLRAGCCLTLRYYRGCCLNGGTFALYCFNRVGIGDKVVTAVWRWLINCAHYWKWH